MVQIDELDSREAVSNEDLLLRLIERPPGKNNAESGIVVGQLIAIAEDDITPMVVFPGQVGSAAIGARSVIELSDMDVGKSVVLTFEQSDLTKPIILGAIRAGTRRSLKESPGTIEVDADGARVVVTAAQQLVLRCGSASITLTKAGKVLIQGTYVSSRSSGVNRVKGGSVQLN